MICWPAGIRDNRADRSDVLYISRKSLAEYLKSVKNGSGVS